MWDTPWNDSKCIIEPICEYDFDDQQKQRLLAYFQRLSDSKKDKVFEYMKDIG